MEPTWSEAWRARHHDLRTDAGPQESCCFAAAIEVQVNENLQREDVHLLEEAFGVSSLLDLNDPNYTVEGVNNPAQSDVIRLGDGPHS